MMYCSVSRRNISPRENNYVVIWVFSQSTLTHNDWYCFDHISRQMKRTMQQTNHDQHNKYLQTNKKQKTNKQTKQKQTKNFLFAQI